MKAAALILLAAIAAGPAAAQVPVTQVGPYTNGHVPAYVGTGQGGAMLIDPGPAGGGGTGVSELEMIAPTTQTGPLGTNFCDYDASLTSATGYHYLCMSPNANGTGALIAYGAGGGAAQLPLTFNINGIKWSPTNGFSTVPIVNGGTGATTAAGAVINLSAIPHVANLTALKAYATATGAAAIRDGYAAAGDAGDPVTYFWSSSACSIAAGAGDNGWQVPGTTGCWIAALPTTGADVRIWGATSPGSDPTNSAAFLAAASAASAGQGGGKVLIPATYFVVAQSAILDFSSYPNISIGCEAGSFGHPAVSNLTAPCTLQINPAYSINLGNNQEFYGLRVVNQNLGYATNARSSLNNANAMAVTTGVAGITVTGANGNEVHDVTVHDVTVNGFAQGIYTTYTQRLNIDHVEGDDTNGLWVNNCDDTCNLSRITFKALLNAGGGQTYNISSATYSAGVTSIVLSAAGSTPLHNGDTIIIYGVGGMPALLGRFTIASLADTTHFTVTGGGSTYTTVTQTGTTVGTSTVAMSSVAGLTVGMSAKAADITDGTLITAISGLNVSFNKATGSAGSESITFGAGQVYLPISTRKGSAYNFTGAGVGGMAIWGLWEYGHDTGLAIGPGAGSFDIHYLWVDGDAANGTVTDNVPVGVNYQGAGSGVFGGALLSKATAIIVNTTDVAGRPFTVNGNVNFPAAGCASSNNATPGAAATVTQGSLSISNSVIRGTNCAAGYAAISVASGAGPVLISNTNMNGFTTAFTTAADAANSKIDGQIMSTLTTPTLTAGFCTGSTVTKANGSASFLLGVGTSACTGIKTGTVTLGAAPNGWTCSFVNVTNPAGNLPRQSGAGTVTTVPMTNYNTGGTPTDFTANDVLKTTCSWN